MTRLVYLSPVRWGSFEQRPHKFVRWFHGRTQAEVLWLDPYHTRFPRLADLARWQRTCSASAPTLPPTWLHVVKPSALPIEPLPVAAHVNRVLWGGLLAEVSRFAEAGQTLLVIGKPSLLASQVLAVLDSCASVYDAMDDFPSFYAGLARRGMHRRERQVASRVDAVWASSYALQQRLAQQYGAVQLVPNGLDPALMPAARSRHRASPLVFGYVGTMASWFDWDVVIALAHIRQSDRICLIGPVNTPPAVALPANVDVHPPLPHDQALAAMREFDVGLIPFKRNRLTAAVDPIKYYEYRALDLPVLSTDFGEMSRRRGQPGVHLIDAISDLATGALQAAMDDTALDADFAQRHCWDAVFDAAKLPASELGADWALTTTPTAAL